MLPPRSRARLELTPRPSPGCRRLARRGAAPSALHHQREPYPARLPTRCRDLRATLGLHAALAEHYPSVWSNHTPAAAKNAPIRSKRNRDPSITTSLVSSLEPGLSDRVKIKPVIGFCLLLSLPSVVGMLACSATSAASVTSPQLEPEVHTERDSATEPPPSPDIQRPEHVSCKPDASRQLRDMWEAAQTPLPPDTIRRASTRSVVMHDDGLLLLDYAGRLHQVPLEGTRRTRVECPDLPRDLASNVNGPLLLTVSVSNANGPLRVWRRSQDQWILEGEVDVSICAVERLVGVGAGWAVFSRNGVYFTTPDGRVEHGHFYRTLGWNDKITCSNDGWCVAGSGIGLPHEAGTFLMVDLSERRLGTYDKEMSGLCDSRLNDAKPDHDRRDCVLLGLGRRTSPYSEIGCAQRSCRSQVPEMIFQGPADTISTAVRSIAQRPGGTVYRTTTAYYEVSANGTQQLATPVPRHIQDVSLSTDLSGIVVVDVNPPGSSFGPEWRLLERRSDGIPSRHGAFRR